MSKADLYNLILEVFVEKPEQIDLGLDIGDIGGELKTLRIKVDTKVREIKNSLQALATEYARRAEFYRIKAEGICERIRMIDGQFANIIGAVQEAPELEKKILGKNEKPLDLRAEVETCVRELGRRGKFTFHDVVKLLRKNSVRVNKKTARSVRSILARMTYRKIIFSERTGSFNTYSLSQPSLAEDKDKLPHIKPGAFYLQALLAIHELETVGSETTANAIRHKLISSHGMTYETLPIRRVENTMYYLLGTKRLVYISKKIGHRTCYKVNEKGKEVIRGVVHG